MIEVVLAPSHLTGALVEHVVMEPGHLPSEYPPNGEKRIFILDRKHPTQEGRIAIAEEDCTTAHVPACCWAAQDAEAAHKLYAAYSLGGPIERAGLAWDGREVPTWEQLQERAAGGDVGAAGVIAKWRAVALLVANEVLHPVLRLAVHADGLAPLPLGAEVHHPVHGPGRVVVSADWAWIEEYPKSRVQCERLHVAPTLAELGVTDACPQV